MKKLIILLLFTQVLYGQNKHIRIEVPTLQATDSIQTFSHAGTIDLLSTLSRAGGSIKITAGTQIEVQPTISGINGIAKIRTNFNGCQNCVGYFGPTAGYVNDSIATDAPFFYQYEEGFGTLNVPAINLTSTNTYNNPVALYISYDTDERVYVSGTDASGFNSTAFFHKVTTASSISLPSGLTGAATHFILNDGFAFTLNRSAGETVNGATSVSYTSADRLVVVTNDGSGKWFAFVPGSGGGGGSPADLAYTVSGSSPITLNSSTGSDVTFVAGTNTTLSATSGAMTINAANADLSYSGVTSPIGLNSSTGSDLIVAAGAGISLAVSGSTMTISGSTNITISGSAPTFNVNSSTGTGVALTGGGGIILSSSGPGQLTIATSGAAGITGTGILNYIPIWTGAGTQSTANIFQTGSNDWTFGTTGSNTMHIGNAAATTNVLTFGNSSNVYIGEAGTDDRLYVRGSSLSIDVAGNLGISGQVLKTNGSTLSYSNDLDIQTLSWSAISSSSATLSILNGNSINVLAGTNVTFNNLGGNLQIASTGAGGGITGSGSTNVHSKWTSSTSLGNSLISDDGSNVTITNAGGAYTYIGSTGSSNMQIGASGIEGGAANRLYFGSGGLAYIGEEVQQDRVVLAGTLISIKVNGSFGSAGQVLTSNGATASWSNPSSGVSGMSTSGSSTQSLIGGSGSLQFLSGSGVNVTFGGTSSIATLTFSSSGLTGSGTAGFLPKFTSASVLANSIYQDNGTNAGIGTAAIAGITLQVPTGDMRIGLSANTTNRLLFGDQGCSTCPYIGEVGADDRLYLNGGSMVFKISGSVGTAGQVITSNGTTATWVTPTSGGSGTVTGISTSGSNILSATGGTGSLQFVGSGINISTTGSGTAIMTFKPTNVALNIGTGTTNVSMSSIDYPINYIIRGRAGSNFNVTSYPAVPGCVLYVLNEDSFGYVSVNFPSGNVRNGGVSFPTQSVGSSTPVILTYFGSNIWSGF